MSILRQKGASFFLALSIFMMSSNSFAKEQEDLKLDSVKELLKKDKLLIEVKKKKTKALAQKKLRDKLKVKKYNYPTQEDFWGFMTEYFLVKNAPQLKWDFQKPDYGIWLRFKEVLERVGFVNKKVRLLVVNSQELYHMGLPGNEGEYYFLISVPFMKALDLSKTEIALVLLEDFIRLEEGLFKKKVTVKNLDKILGSNFYQKKVQTDFIKKINTSYYKHTFEQGFTFEEQFKVTKKMKRILSGSSELNKYYSTALGKIDSLVKSNESYKQYLKIYPSPEMQLEWLKPGKR